MALYSINSGKVITASAAAKVAVQVGCASGVTAKVVGFDVSFDGTDASKTPVLVELCRETGVSSTGGTAPTPVQIGGGQGRTAQSTARINDTTDGASPTVLAAWLISPTAAFSYQFPLGREVEGGPFGTAAASYLALRLTTVAGTGTPNYDATLYIEE